MIKRGDRHLMSNLSPRQHLLLQILTLWVLLIAATLGAMLLPPTADAAACCAIHGTGAAGAATWAAPVSGE